MVIDLLLSVYKLYPCFLHIIFVPQNCVHWPKLLASWTASWWDVGSAAMALSSDVISVKSG